MVTVLEARPAEMWTSCWRSSLSPRWGRRAPKKVSLSEGKHPLVLGAELFTHNTVIFADSHKTPYTHFFVDKFVSKNGWLKNSSANVKTSNFNLKSTRI